MGRSLKTYKQEKAAIKGISGGGKKTTVSATQPSNPIEGEIWYNESNEITYIAVENDTTSTIEWKEKSSAGGSGISLTDLSIVTNDAAGGGSIVYNDSTGVFTYTPPSVPDTAGFASAASIPTTLTDLGITDGSNGDVLQTDGSGNFSFVTPQSGGAVTVYSLQDSLPQSNNSVGDMAFAEDTDRLFFWTGEGWYQIALVNQSPTISGAQSSYDLATDGTPTVVTLTITDPEGFSVTPTYSTSGLTNQATVSQGTGANSNVFTITPSTNEANAGTFTVTFTASDGVNSAVINSTFDLTFAAPPGGVLFDTVGTTNWTVPAGVTSICAVCVGGGGGGSGSTLSTNGTSGGGGGGGSLNWHNDISVTPGEILTVTVGAGGTGGSVGSNNATTGGQSYIQRSGSDLIRAMGGVDGVYNTIGGSGAAGGQYLTINSEGGGSGGRGGGGSDGNVGGGGGGAGGYSGNGGDGSTYNVRVASTGSGGGGGGCAGTNSFTTQVTWGGGGVGVYGQGANGGPSLSAYVTGSGSTSYTTNSNGQAQQGSGGAYTRNYGGGGNGAEDDSGARGANGGQGAVRIIWGAGREFPSTNVDLASSTTGETTV